MDLNGDGARDILSGSYSWHKTPMAGAFQVLWGGKKGEFKQAEILNGTDGKPLIIPAGKKTITKNICTRPFAVDWDKDGDLDLVVGNFEGTFFLFKGEGKGKFDPAPEQIMAGKKELKINGVHSDPFVVDWDGDGDLDLLSGSSQGGVCWAENVAAKGEAPKFEGFDTLISSTGKYPYGSILTEKDVPGPASSTRIWIDDVNKDGKLDILVGDKLTLLSPAKGLTKEEMKKREAEWRAKLKKAMVKLRSTKAGAEERKEASRAYAKLYQQRREFVNEQRTGFVWLYLQK